MTDTAIGFHWFNYLVMGGYLLLVVGLGVWFSRDKIDTETYLLGGRGMAWWVIGISYMISLVSTVSLVSVPGEAYKYGASMAVGIFITPFATIGGFLLFVRFYFKRRIFTPFDYLEQRFDARVRATAASIYCLTRVTYLAMVLYASAKVLQGAAGLPLWLTIIVIGTIGVVYTVLGGIRAVVWTDVIQFILLVGGLLLVATQLCISVKGGAAGILEIAHSENHLFSELKKPSFFAFDPRVRVTLWFIIITMISEALFFNSGDQIAIQRLLCTSTYHQAWRSIWTYISIGLPFNLLLWFVGIAIFSYYSQQPEELRPTQGDLALYTFIGNNLPVPVPGLILSAMLAAAMSTLDSGINSLATVVTKDFYLRFFQPMASEIRQVRFSQYITVIIGLFAVLASLSISDVSERIEDTIMEAMGIWGSLGALIAPIFVLGVTSRRLRSGHIFAALTVGFVALLSMLVIRFINTASISFLVIGPLTLIVTLVVGYGIAIFVKPLPRKATKDLTY